MLANKWQHIENIAVILALLIAYLAYKFFEYKRGDNDDEA